MFKAEILHSVDLDNSKLDHRSISGGRATHSLNYVTTMKADTLKELKTKLKSEFGQAYDAIENRLFLSIPESEWSEKECPENYEAVITKVTEEEINMENEV